MHFVIVGAGALGTLYAAHLARAGHQVSLVARGIRAADVRQHGIRVVGSETFSAECRVVTEPSELSGADALILCVKTYDTESALAPLSRLKPDCAFSVQNGVQKNQALMDCFGTDRVLGAVGMLGGEVVHEAGSQLSVRYQMPGPTVIGEMTGEITTRVEQIVSAMTEAGLNARCSDCISSVEWSKFVGWSGVSALAVLTRLPSATFSADSDTALLVARVMRETAQVAIASGADLEASGMTNMSVVTGTEAEAQAAVQANGTRMLTSSPGFRQSILQDADRGRRLEVDETLGYTLSLAADLDVATPTLDFCCRILRVISRSAT